MMRYRVRTLLLIVTFTPIIIAGFVWILTPPDPNVPRNSAGKRATEKIRQLFLSATSLEILEAGDAMPMRATVFHGDSLKKIADAATIHDVQVTNVPSTAVANAYIHFRLMKDDAVMQEYWFRYPGSLVDDSPQHNPDGYWTNLIMSPSFVRAFLNELTTAPR